MDNTIRCIYCKDIKPKPRRGEHVMLDALRGTTCINCVCEDCNSALSKLDLAFTRNSILTLARALDERAAEGQVIWPQFAKFEDGWVDCVVHTGPLRSDVVPQILLVGSALKLVAAPTDQPAAEAFLRGLMPSAIDNVHRDIKDIAQYQPTRLILRPTRRTYELAIRADSLASATKFASTLAKVLPWKVGEWSATAGPEPDNLLFRYDLNVPGRAAAKMAFNFLAYRLGAEFALRDEFDPVRGFIIGSDVQKVRHVRGPDGEVGGTVDLRFVSNPWVPGTECRLPMPGEGHGILLFSRGGFLGSVVEFFSGFLQLRVLLGKLPIEALPVHQFPVVHFTPLAGGGDRVLEWDDVVREYAPSQRVDDPSQQHERGLGDE